MVVSAPCPGNTTVSGGSGSSRASMLAMIVSRSPAANVFPGPPREQGVAADQRVADPQRDAARSVPRGEQDVDPHRSHPHLGAVVEAAVDTLLRDVHLGRADVHRRARGGAHRVVRRPVVGVPVGGDHLLNAALGRDGVEQRPLLQGHVDEQRHPGLHVANDVRVVPVGTHRPDLDDPDAAGLVDGDVSHAACHPPGGHCRPRRASPLSTLACRPGTPRARPRCARRRASGSRGRASPNRRASP